jgi:hypothetical protein
MVSILRRPRCCAAWSKESRSFCSLSHRLFIMRMQIIIIQIFVTVESNLYFEMWYPVAVSCLVQSNNDVIGEGDIGHMITRVLESWTTTDKVKWCGERWDWWRDLNERWARSGWCLQLQDGEVGRMTTRLRADDDKVGRSKREWARSGWHMGDENDETTHEGKVGQDDGWGRGWWGSEARTMTSEVWGLHARRDDGKVRELYM